MLLENIKELIARDLDKVITEINLYANDADLWLTNAKISNSTGNLALHLVGNLNTFIGQNLGNTGYQRNRPAEFGDKNYSKIELIQQLNETKNMVAKVLGALSPSDLKAVYPLEKFEDPSVQFFLLHLITHLNYHLGQINYHRRLLAAM